MANATGLTEVEGCALGVVWQRGPCTAYEVRMEFAVSSTPRWSASAGSIYPALKRLLARRLVEAESEDWGPRSKTRFAITARGRAQLQRWIGPPFGGVLAGPTFDPIRTRSCFLGAMARPQRARFVNQARRETRSALEVLRGEAALPYDEGDFEAMSLRGSVLELEARMRWLDELSRRLGGHAPVTTPITTVRRRNGRRRLIGHADPAR
jgi:DNA-binding PadR family transcriptional regulator